MNRLIGITFAVCCLASASASAQTLGVGDPAPKLDIDTWVKGDAVDLSKGKGKNVYVIEFWATWCPPCVMAIPHLTEIQKKYRDQNVVMVSVTDEPKHVVTKFMRQQGDKMGYTVAIDKQQKTTQAYMNASGQMGIPTSFIVDRQGKIAWIGSPYSMDRVLEEVVAGRFDIDKAKAEAKAEEKFFSTQYTELLLAMQSANWDKCVTIGRMVADPNTKISEALKSQILHSLAWAMLDHERADRKYFKEALHLAKAAFEVCGCEEASIIDTYARALFDNGQPREAVKYQQKAVELATDIMMRAELQNALKRYQAAAGAGS